MSHVASITSARNMQHAPDQLAYCSPLHTHCRVAQVYSPERAVDRARATRRHTSPLARSDIPTACKGRRLVVPLQPGEGIRLALTEKFKRSSQLTDRCRHLSIDIPTSILSSTVQSCQVYS